MESILRYYDDHLKLVNMALKVIEDDKISENDLRNILNDLIYSISNEHGAINIFFHIYLKEFDDAHDDDEADDLHRKFKEYRYGIMQHMSKNWPDIKFNIQDKIKDLKINSDLEIELEERYFPPTVILRLNKEELVLKIEEYISLSLYYIQYYFYLMEAQLKEVFFHVNESINKKRDESRSRKDIKSEYRQWLKDNPQEVLSEEAIRQNDRKISEQFERLNDKIEDPTLEGEVLIKENIKEETTIAIPVNSEENDSQIELKSIPEKKVKVKKEKDKSFNFKVVHIKDKESLINFIRNTAIEKEFFEDANHNQMLIDILFSKDLIADDLGPINFNLRTTRIKSFINFIVPYYEPGLIKKIERCELFYSEGGNLIDAQNLYSTKLDEDFLQELNEKFEVFKKKLKE